MIRCHQELKMWIASITDDHYTMEWSYMTNGDETEFISPSYYLSQRLASRSETHLVASVIFSVLVLEVSNNSLFYSCVPRNLHTKFHINGFSGKHQIIALTHAETHSFIIPQIIKSGFPQMGIAL